MASQDPQNEVQMSYHDSKDIFLHSGHTPSFLVHFCTWCSIMWNMIEPIPAWVTPYPPLRLSEGIIPSRGLPQAPQAGCDIPFSLFSLPLHTALFLTSLMSSWKVDTPSYC